MDIYKIRAEVIKALAHPTRLRIVDFLLSNGEACVCDIAAFVQASQPMVSKHMAQMRDAGVLESRKEGSMVFYKVSTPCIQDFFKCLDTSIEKSLENRRAALEK